MKTLVISYSFTGNNEALAKSICSEIKADHIAISEPKKRTILTFTLDLLFNRTPSVKPKANEIIDKIKNYDLVIFVGSVWFGQVATPLRSYFSILRSRLNKYAFISISGGAAGPNPKLEEELTQKIGKKPAVVINLFIADLLPQKQKPTMKDTSNYHISEEEVKSLTKKILKTLHQI